MASSAIKSSSAALWLRIVSLAVGLAGMGVCERIAGAGRPIWYMAGRIQTATEVVVFTLVMVASYVGAGLLIDGFGVRRVVALGLLGFAALTVLGGVITDTAVLRAIGALVELPSAIFLVGAAAAIRLELAPRATALALVLFGLSVYLWPLADPALYALRLPPPTGLARPWPAVICAAIAVGAALVWFVAYPDRHARQARASPHALPWPLLRSVLGLTVLYGLAAMIFDIITRSAFYFLEVDRNIDARTIGAAIYLPNVLAGLAVTGAAIWSDRRRAQGLTPGAARWPFVFAGFVLCAVVGLLPDVEAVLPALTLAGTGAGLQALLAVAFLDIAPRHRAGLFAGLAFAADATAVQVLGWVSLRLIRATHSYGPVLLFGTAVALVSAVAAFVLLRRLRTPDEPVDRQAVVTEVFG